MSTPGLAAIALASTLMVCSDAAQKAGVVDPCFSSLQAAAFDASVGHSVLGEPASLVPVDKAL